MRPGMLRTIGVALAIQAAATVAGAEMRMVRSRAYVIGYEVQGNFVLPVMGTIENGVIVRTDGYGRRRRSSEPVYSYSPPDRKRLDAFFAESETAGWVAGDKKAGPPARPRPAPVITGLMRLTGRISTTADGRPWLIVSSGARETRYDLSGNEHLMDTLSDLLDLSLRAHLTGVVSAGAPHPKLQIRSGWFEVM